MKGDTLDFSPRESALIGQIMKAERTLPDDFWHVPAVQEIACILARYEAVMADEDIATVTGCAALLARHGKAEMKAEIEMKMLQARAQHGSSHG